MIAEFLRELLSVAVVVFSMSTMAGIGLGHTPRDVFGPMADVRAVIGALMANFVLVPLLAYALIQVMPLDPSYATGLMLIATAAGAAFLIKLTAAAGGNVALSASLTMLLLPTTVLYMPFIVPIVAPGAKVSPAAIAVPLLWTMILPLLGGLIVRALFAGWAKRAQRWLGKLSNLALVVLVLATVLANLSGIGTLVREGAIFAPLLLIVGASAIGYLFGREYRGGHVVLALGTGQRNIAAAMVVASQGMDDPNVLVMVVVASLVGFAVLFPLSWILRRKTRHHDRIVSA